VLNAHAAWIQPPLWAFSTEVHPATLRRGKLATHTTGGTELACVYAHLRKTKAHRALVITDGYVENDLPAPPCHMEALIDHKGYAENLEKAGIGVTRLPVFPKG
jgi:predicted metal-dependent peptidase